MADVSNAGSNVELDERAANQDCHPQAAAELDDTNSQQYDTNLNTEFDVKASPAPSSSPSPEEETSEQMLSRKREREVSLEPATPKTAAGSSHASDSKSPAKKGRVQLDTTVEEDERSHPHSRTPSSNPHSQPHSPRLGLGIGLSSSPPHEIKVRQISQGVEDISWRQTLAQDKESQETCDVEEDRDTDKDAEDEQASIPQEGGLGAPDGSLVEADEALDATPSLPSTRRASDSDGGGEQEKGLKRKLADRGTSQGPEGGPTTSANPTTEAAKRPRDDPDADDNPRETKRPSPPPEDTPPAPKLGGFMAYASSASPFAAVKGQNIFSSGGSSTSKRPSAPTSLPANPSPSLFPNSISQPSPFSSQSSPFPTNTQPPPSSPFEPSSPPTAAKRTGFEAFAGSASPFASSALRSKSPTGKAGHGLGLHRSKSPPRRTGFAGTSAFSTYASGGAHAFGGAFGVLGGAPVLKRARAGSPSDGSSRSSLERSGAVGLLDGSGSGNGSGSGEDEGEEDERRGVSTFGERLRAGKDGEEEVSEEEKEKLTEKEVMTGEEDEETIHQVRGKLYALCLQNQWKERGTGLLKVNVRRSDGSGARLGGSFSSSHPSTHTALVMRKEAVYTVLLNVTLFPGMKCFLAQDPRYIRFSVIENGGTTHYNLRVSNAKIAQELLEEINANIPSE
ncbi:hypothetical protein BV22DRAFT_1131270 [Leucogyrophana mollusca]|uniref:Uncharacterized protein n=1 Tax=Leucogyrophana mollusca TaxID=85980 RepID=A0ACB8BCC0_9AGAM|nr:hypothetical protein BV22DRAFT_1131270 [Leucogyrophana mollusca]